MKIAIIIILSMLIGFFLGVLAGIYRVLSTYYAGELKWMEDEDGAYPFIAANEPFDILKRRRFVLLKVDGHATNTDAFKE